MNVAIGILQKHGRLLIAQRKPPREFPYTWEFPGGKEEESDVNSVAALRRELKEELGINIGTASGAVSELIRLPYPHNTSITLIFHKVRAWEGIPSLRDHLGLIWVDPFEIPKYPLINSAMMMAVGAILV